MMAKMFSGGTILLAAATTCPNKVFPAIWCSTLGCRDFSRVPFPAARIAMAKSNLLWPAEWAEPDCGFIMTLQGIKRSLGFVFCGGDRGFARVKQQAQKIMRHVVGVVPGDQTFIGIEVFGEIVAKNRLYTQSLDLLGIHHDLRLLLLGVLRRQGRRRSRVVDQGIVEELMPRVIVNRLDMLRCREVQAFIGLCHQVANVDLGGSRVLDRRGKAAHQ